MAVCSSPLRVLLVALLAASAFVTPVTAGRRLSQYVATEDPLWPNRHPQSDQSNATTVGEWKVARSTAAYNNDGMNLDQAACAFGHISPDQWGGRGLQVAAMSDRNPEYTGSCGRCYELRCANMNFSDAFGAFMPRDHACIDPTASIVVKIVDTCPCDYPGNWVSNKRWCCGDMTHFDLSYWAFQKMANPRVGVIALNYRTVPCNFQPANDLGPVGWPEGWPSSSYYKMPNGIPDDQLEFTAPPPSAVAPFNSSAAGAIPAANSTSKPRLAVNATAATLPGQAPPSSAEAPPSPAPSQPPPPSATPAPPALPAQPLAAGAPSSGAASRTLYSGGSYQSGSYDASASLGGASNPQGNAKCSVIYSCGSMGFGTPSGTFVDMDSLSFRARAADGAAPNLSINLATDQGATCSAQSLSGLGCATSDGGWVSCSVQLSAFAGASGNFDGCGGSTAEHVTRLSFSNQDSTEQEACIDNVKLSA